MVNHNVEIGDHFYNDCVDYLLRVELTRGEFDIVKSRRLKLFVDLRQSYECVLKSLTAVSMTDASDGSALLRKVEKNKHRIELLEKQVFATLPFELEAFGGDLDKLPVDLRYSVDCLDFIEAHQELYYRTVGSDSWIDRLVGQATRLRDHVGNALASYSGILRGDELWDAIVNARPNKFRPRVSDAEAEGEKL